MKIVVIGGTGFIGSQVVQHLQNLDHTVIVGTPSNGIDVLTGEGLAKAMENTDVVIDLSNSSSPEEENAVNFFQKAGQHLVEAEKFAGIKHHVILSIVGTDRVPFVGYLRAKKNQEDQIKESGIPYTIIRSTQFHEHITTLLAVQSEGNEVHVSTMDYQPVAAAEVVEYVVSIALGAPKNEIVEIAGPVLAPMNEFVNTYVELKGVDKTVVANDRNQYMFFTFPKSGLVPEGDFHPGKISFEEWAKK